MTAAAVPLIISAAGSIGGMMIQNEAQQQAQDERNAQIMRMRQLATQAENKNIALSDQQTQNYQPAVRQQQVQKAAQAATDSLAGILTAGRDASGPAYEGNVSDAYTTAKAKSDAAVLDKAHQWAVLMGKMRAPTDLFRQEGFDNANIASQRDTNAANYRTDQATQQLKYNAIQPDSGMMFLGDLAKLGGNLAGTYAGSKLGGVSDPASGVTPTGGAGLDVGLQGVQGAGTNYAQWWPTLMSAPSRIPLSRSYAYSGG